MSPLAFAAVQMAVVLVAFYAWLALHGQLRAEFDLPLRNAPIFAMMFGVFLMMGAS